MPKKKQQITTVEADSYLDGLYREFHEQVARYAQLTRNHMELQARIELAEKTIHLMRDHLATAIAQTDCAAPRDWGKTFNIVRFVGLRASDACVSLLRERKKLTTHQFLDALNLGMFRFRTNTPLREIHAGLLKQPFVKRRGDTWIWTGPSKEESAALLTARVHLQMNLAKVMKSLDEDAGKETEGKKE